MCIRDSTVTVGAGGRGGSAYPGERGITGGNSSFGPVTALGGGGGGSNGGDGWGGDGGSGGGAAVPSSTQGGAASPQPVPGDYTAYGNAGAGDSPYGPTAAGGGGAGGSGTAGTSNSQAGQGGLGKQIPATFRPMMPAALGAPGPGGGDCWVAGGGGGGAWCAHDPVTVDGGGGGTGPGASPSDGPYAGGGQPSPANLSLIHI